MRLPATLARLAQCSRPGRSTITHRRESLVGGPRTLLAVCSEEQLAHTRRPVDRLVREQERWGKTAVLEVRDYMEF